MLGATITNVTTGKSIEFGYSISQGEVVYINLKPQVTSLSRPSRLNLIVPSALSSFATFAIEPDPQALWVVLTILKSQCHSLWTARRRPSSAIMNTTSAFRVVLSVFLILIWNIVFSRRNDGDCGRLLAAEWGDNDASITPYVSSALRFQNAGERDNG